MKLFHKYNNTGISRLYYKGRKNNFIFTVDRAPRWGNRFFFYCSHKSKDIRYNSLWKNITYPDLEAVKQACEEFDPSQHSCLGKDFEGKGSKS